MNKLTIIKGNEKYNIYIENYKILLGQQYQMKFDIVRTLKRYIQNIKPSEYAEENNNIANILINDKIIKPKNCLYFYVHKYYSISDDFKLTAQSLIFKYLEVLLNNEELIDTVNTINLLFESLSQEISSISSVSGHFNTMVSKQLLKLISPYYIDEEEYKDEYDLTLEEIIIFQLKLISYISQNIKNIQYIILCIELPRLTNEIYEYIQQIDNCMILIIIDNQSIVCNDISKYVICENIYIDLANDEEIYNSICDNHIQLLTLEEGKQYMKDYIYNKDTYNQRFIRKILKSK